VLLAIQRMQKTHSLVVAASSSGFRPTDGLSKLGSLLASLDVRLEFLQADVVVVVVGAVEAVLVVLLGRLFGRPLEVLRTVRDGGLQAAQVVPTAVHLADVRIGLCRGREAHGNDAILLLVEDRNVLDLYRSSAISHLQRARPTN
jgi:hypothetical protein